MKQTVKILGQQGAIVAKHMDLARGNYIGSTYDLNP